VQILRRPGSVKEAIAGSMSIIDEDQPRRVFDRAAGR
jgi:hypothetical protein